MSTALTRRGVLALVAGANRIACGRTRTITWHYTDVITDKMIAEAVPDPADFGGFSHWFLARAQTTIRRCHADIARLATDGWKLEAGQPNGICERIEHLCLWRIHCSVTMRRG